MHLKYVFLSILVQSLVTISVLADSQQSLLFKNLTSRHGLSANKVNAALQDKKGFLWFATEDGLNKFDGYEIKIYRNDPDNPFSLSGNDVWSMVEDVDGNIWIGTKTGELNKYIYESDSFIRYIIDSTRNRENGITSIFKDINKNLWIGTYRNGLYKFNPLSGEFKNWNYDPANFKSISNNFITGIIQDKNENIWISTYNGLNKFNPRKPNEGFKSFYYEADNSESINNNLVWFVNYSKNYRDELWVGTANGLSRIDINDNKIKRFPIPVQTELMFGNSISAVIEDNKNNESVLWIGTYGGLIKYNLVSGKYERFISDEKLPVSIISNQINKLLLDSSGVLWIATENGISSWSSQASKFNPNEYQEQNLKSISSLINKNINAFQKSNDGKIWIGTSEGLFTLNFLNNTPELKKISALDGKNIWSLHLNSDNILWVGTYGQGLFIFDTRDNRLTPVEIKSPTFQTNAYGYVKSIYEDDQKNIWVGFWGGGIAKVKNGQCDIWVNQPGEEYTLSYNDVWSILQDRQGRLWIGTNGGGLNLIRQSDKKVEFLVLERRADKNKDLSSKVIYTMIESSKHSNDNQTVLWIGTASGLNKVTLNNEYGNPKELLENIFIEHYTTNDGLPENIIKSIVEDDDGNLWISTNSGLSKFDVNTNTFSNYNDTDGINNVKYNSGSVVASKNGLIFFGGTKGADYFYQQSIEQSKYAPPIVFTDFLIFNQRVTPGKDSPLHSNISMTESIELAYSQNVFSFYYAALDYNSPVSVKYAYMMEGFDNDWIYVKSNRSATYTNLNPGNYNFKVKATNSDGVWVENTASIKLKINSPWWRTYWAYASYAFIIIAGLYLIRKTEFNRAKLQNELRLRELESEKLREIEKIKSRFFANLSHEFRTPLMLIKGPAEQLVTGRGSNSEEQAKLIQKNAEKLQTLIDQLLELTQLEAGSLNLKAKKDNIVVFTKGIFYSFESLAKQKSIVLEFDAKSEKIYAWFDGDKFEKIINNLLSNAVKFTSDGGKISININEFDSEEGDYIMLTVRDTGIGIPEDKLNKVFDRFYQVDDSSRRAYGGSGIGLSLVRELVDLHKWYITVESESGIGTQFYIKIPSGDLHLDETQKIVDGFGSTEDIENISVTEVIQFETPNENEKLTSTRSEVHNQQNNRKTILIVEDSEDVRTYLTDLLQADYNIMCAENGEKGLSAALEKLPDLIISDVMMPEMDGMEFCRRIKSDWLTSHIPIILLTAKASIENKIEGLETGADDYLTKPFSFRELSARIKNLLEQRLKLQQKYGKDSNLKIENITPNKADQEFLYKAINIVEKNLSNTEFDSDKFAQQIFVSRSQLHRKIHAITGQSTGEFIRTIRLKKAAGLLIEKELSITQIAFEVGFNSPSHFTKAFKQIFNCLPSEYIYKSNS